MRRHNSLLASAAFMALAVNAGAMQITIVPGANLAANSDALAAFQRSADIWDAIFTDPILVTVNADLSALGAGIIGSTSTVDVQRGYDTVRNQLVADSAGQAGKSIVASLPTAAQFTAQLPAGFSPDGNIVASKANLKAMGFAGLDGTLGVSDGSITFNSDTSFYFGAGGSVPAGQIDFQTVATHELGHLLGFFSAVDEVAFLMSQNTPQAISIDPLDLYRFGTANLPSTNSQFTNDARSLAPGAPAFTSDTVVQYSMSTGLSFGDGHQASHWKDDSLSGTYIGVMDPTLVTGVREALTAADIWALALIGYDVATPIGYDVATPEPGTMVLIAGAMIGLIAFRRRQTGPRLQ